MAMIIKRICHLLLLSLFSFCILFCVFFFLQVLMTYWDMDEYQVEDVMTEFLKKSLAQSEFDSTLGTSMSILSKLYINFILFLF